MTMGGITTELGTRRSATKPRKHEREPGWSSWLRVFVADPHVQITSAKYRSSVLNRMAEATSSTAMIVPPSPTSDQSGGWVNTSAVRLPSMIAVSGFSEKKSRYLSGTFDRGYATGVRYSHSCSAIVTTGLTSR